MTGEKVALGASLALPTVLPGSAEDAAAFLERPDGPLWYVAYGSNLNFSVFKGRRGIKPIEERHVVVEGLELTFDLPGLPYIEPRFANCRFASTSTSMCFTSDGTQLNGDGKAGNKVRSLDIDLNSPWTGKGAFIGVAYLVLPADFANIIKTEGGGSGYRMVSVEAEVFESKSNSGEKEVRYEYTGETVNAFTLLAPEEKTRKSPGQPSVRYLSLIRKGAEQHDLPPGYRAYLASLSPYARMTFRQKLGAAISVGMLLPFFGIVALGFAFARKDGSAPHWVSELRDALIKSAWYMHDGWLRNMFGDGERTVEQDAGHLEDPAI